MAKYSFQMKMEIIKAYLNDEGGYAYLAKKYGIPDAELESEVPVCKFNFRFGTSLARLNSGELNCS